MFFIGQGHHIDLIQHPIFCLEARLPIMRISPVVKFYRLFTNISVDNLFF